MFKQWWNRNITARIRDQKIKRANSHITWAKAQAKYIFNDNTYKQQTEIVEAMKREVEILKETRIVKLESLIEETQREIQEIIESR